MHDVDGPIRERHGVGRAGAERGGQHPADAVVGHHRARELLEEEPDDAEREGEDGEQGHGLHQLAGGEVAASTPARRRATAAATVPRFGRASRPGSKPARRRPDDEAGLAQLLGGGVACESTSRCLEAEGLHDEDAVEALVGHRGHVADAGLGQRRGLLHPPGVGVVEQGQAREQGQPRRRGAPGRRRPAAPSTRR